MASFAPMRCPSGRAVLVLLAMLLGTACDSGEPGDQPLIRLPVPNTQPMRFGAPIWHPDASLWMVHHRPMDADGTPIDSLAGIYTLRPDGTDLQPFILCHGGCPLRLGNWAPSGDWIVVSGAGPWNGRLFRIAYPEGTITDISGTDGQPKFWPSISPDGKRIAYRRGSARDWELSVMNIDGTSHRVIRNFERRKFGDPTWGPSPHQLTIAYRSYVTTVDTLTGALDRIGPHLPVEIRSPQWSPDRQWLLYNRMPSVDADFMIRRMHVSGAGSSTLARIAVGPRWSPDGRQISYTRYSNRTADIPGYGEIWLMNADGSNKRQITRR